MLSLPGVAVCSEAEVIMESPFLCIFDILFDNEEVPVVLMGNLGRAIFNSNRISDITGIQGVIVNGEHLGHHKILLIKKVTETNDPSYRDVAIS